MNSLQYWHVPISEYYAVTGSTHLTLVICHSLFVFAVYLITWWGDKYPVRKSCGIERRRKARQDRSIFAADAKESPVISETIFPIIYISISASVVCSFCLFDCSHTTQANCRLLSILEPDSLFIYSLVCFWLKGFVPYFPCLKGCFPFLRCVIWKVTQACFSDHLFDWIANSLFHHHWRENSKNAKSKCEKI